MSETQSCLIVGAGMTGLTAAGALRARKWSVVLRPGGSKTRSRRRRKRELRKFGDQSLRPWCVARDGYRATNAYNWLNSQVKTIALDFDSRSKFLRPHYCAKTVNMNTP